MQWKVLRHFRRHFPPFSFLMSVHPFQKLFLKALKESTPFDNQVLAEAEALRQKGYSVEEIHDVLKKLHAGLVQEEDIEIMGEALEEFESYKE